MLVFVSMLAFVVSFFLKNRGWLVIIRFICDRSNNEFKDCMAKSVDASINN